MKLEQTRQGFLEGNQLLKQVTFPPEKKGPWVANKATKEHFCKILQNQGRDMEDGGEG